MENEGATISDEPLAVLKVPLVMTDHIMPAKVPEQARVRQGERGNVPVTWERPPHVKVEGIKGGKCPSSTSTDLSLCP